MRDVQSRRVGNEKEDPSHSSQSPPSDESSAWLHFLTATVNYLLFAAMTTKNKNLRFEVYLRNPVLRSVLTGSELHRSAVKMFARFS